ncbi:MAG: riboflavin biosynthesis protein RibF [Bacteroidota bacterium]
MRIARSPEEAGKEPNSVVTVGSFDGVHEAHRVVLHMLVRRARERGGRSVVITFEPPPKTLLGPGAGKAEVLTTLDERSALIGACGVDLLLVLPFTREFAGRTAAEFYEGLVAPGVGVAEVVVGHGHTFGRNREGRGEELRALGSRLGFRVRELGPVTDDGRTISSTLIRDLLARGSVEEAARLLGYPYSLASRVVAGDGRGRTLGFPTANLEPAAERKVVPADGVYLVDAPGTGPGMLNLGLRPTVTPGTRRTMEAHFFGFQGNLYGRELRVSFLQRLRDEKRFDTAEELRAQLHADRDRALSLMARIRPHETQRNDTDT